MSYAKKKSQVTVIIEQTLKLLLSLLVKLKLCQNRLNKLVKSWLIHWEVMNSTLNIDMMIFLVGDM